MGNDIFLNHEKGKIKKIVRTIKKYKSTKKEKKNKLPTKLLIKKNIGKTYFSSFKGVTIIKSNEFLIKNNYITFEEKKFFFHASIYEYTYSLSFFKMIYTIFFYQIVLFSLIYS